MIRYDGIEGSAIIDAAPGNLNGEIPSPFQLQSSLENVQEFRVESSNYPGRIRHRHRRPGQRRHQVGRQHRPRLGVRVRPRRQVRSPNYFERMSTCQKIAAVSRTSSADPSAGRFVKDRAFFFGSYEGYRLDSGINFVEGVPSAAAWPARGACDRAAVRRVPRARRGGAARRVGQPRLRHRCSCRRLQTSRENSFSGAARRRSSTTNWTMYGRVLPRRRPERPARRRHRPTGTHHGEPGERGRRPAGRPDAADDQRSSRSATTRRRPRISGVGAGRQRHRSLATSRSTSAAASPIPASPARAQLRASRFPAACSRQNSATNGRGAPYDPYSLSFIDTLTLEHAARTREDRRRVPR